MIDFAAVSVRYPGTEDLALDGVDLHVPEGELCLVVGRTGSGKSTLLRAVNGLVPHFTGGTLHGRVTVDGRDTRTSPPRELADLVGFVGQDPLSGFVTDTVEEELAFAMESLGVAPAVMRRRVEEVLDLLSLADLRDRAVASLSAGQQQRVAIGSVLTAHPKVLVLDEPTSALDPPAAEEVLAAVQRLVHDLGVTAVVAEHRLERVVQYADRVVTVTGGHVVADEPARAMATSPVAPPVVGLGRLAGWSPLPLSVRDARRAAGPLRRRLAGAVPSRPVVPPGPTVASVRGLVVRYGGTPALRGVDVAVGAGELVAFMGRNGAGKSTLLGALAGLRAPAAGTVTVAGTDPRRLRAGDLARTLAFVPQEPVDLLYAESVAAECAAAGAARALLDELAPGIPGDRHPRDLSEGQRLALALAVTLARRPPLVLLDEPTRGLDYPAKARLVAVLRRLVAAGHAVLVATHDVELVAEVASRVVVLADGEVVADGLAADVVVGSPAFAPQVAKVLAPQPWLTVDEVAAALGAAS